MYRVWKLKTGLGRRNPASGAIWKLRRSPDRIGFRYPSADTTQRFPRNTTDCTTIPGPKANFVVFVILQIMPKRLTNENQARKVTQTRYRHRKFLDDRAGHGAQAGAPDNDVQGGAAAEWFP